MFKVEGGRCCTLALAGGMLLERGVALWWETREGTAEGRTLDFSGRLGGDIVVQSYESVRRGQVFHLLITSDEGVAVHVEVASQGLCVA